MENITIIIITVKSCHHHRFLTVQGTGATKEHIIIMETVNKKLVVNIGKRGKETLQRKVTMDMTRGNIENVTIMNNTFCEKRIVPVLATGAMRENLIAIIVRVERT